MSGVSEQFEGSVKKPVTCGNNCSPTVAGIAGVMNASFHSPRRRNMLKSSIAVTVVAAVAALSGCASQAELVGAGTGAAVGAAVGGGPMATVGGAMVGYGAGHVYDQKHR
jgi:hypothetical protein